MTTPVSEMFFHYQREIKWSNSLWQNINSGWKKNPDISNLVSCMDTFCLYNIITAFNLFCVL